MAVQKGWGKNLGVKPAKGPDAADVVGQLFSELVGSQPADELAAGGEMPGAADEEAALTESLRQLSELANPEIDPTYAATGPVAVHDLEFEQGDARGVASAAPEIPEVTLDPNILSMFGEESRPEVTGEAVRDSEANSGYGCAGEEIAGLQAAVHEAVAEEPVAQELVEAACVVEEAVACEAVVREAVVREAVVREAVAREAVTIDTAEREATARGAVTIDTAADETAAIDTAASEAAPIEAVTIDTVASTVDEPVERVKAPERRDVAQPQMRRPHTFIPAAADAHEESDSGQLDHVIQAIDSEVARAPFVINFARAGAEREAKTHSTTPWIIFTLAGTRYAVPIHQVTETDLIPAVTPVPYTPAFVRGVTNLRGEIIAVLDLRSLLGLEHRGRLGRERMLVVRAGEQQMTAAMVVDEVRGIDRFSENDLRQAAGPINDKVANLLRGTFEHEGRVLNVLDLEKLFQSADMRQLTAA